jgi:hypothetical protein
MKAFCYNADSRLFKSWSLVIGRGHNREHHIFMCLYIFLKSSPELADQFQSNSKTIYLSVKDILNCSNKGAGPLQRKDHYLNAKMGWGHLKLFFSRLTDQEYPRYL